MISRFVSCILSIVMICGGGLASASAEDLGTTGRKVEQLLKAQDFRAAEPHVRAMMAMIVKAEGRDSDGAANAAHTLAYTLMNEGKNAEAEPFARQALATWQKVKGPSSGAAGNAANTLAIILMNLSRDAEAEPFVRLHVVALEREAGSNSGAVANALNTQIRLFRSQGRSAEALAIAQRVKLIWERDAGQNSGASANISNTIAIILNDLGRPAEAEPYIRHALEVWEKVEPRAVPNGRNTLADTLNRLGRSSEALEQSRLVIEGWAKNDGPNSGAVALGSNNLAFKYLGLGQLDQAEAQFQRAYDIWSKSDGQNPGRGTAIALGGLADVAFLRENWERSYDLREKAVAIWIDRTLRTAAGVRLAGAEKSPSEIAQSAAHLSKLVRSAHQIIKITPAKRAALTSITFAFAQWRLSSGAADALAEMATRSAANDVEIANLVRDRQDRVDEWQKADKQVAEARGANADRRDQRVIEDLEKKRVAIDTRIAAIDTVLKSKFPRFAELAITQPLSVQQVQAELHPDEALVLILDTTEDKPLPEETFIWVVTKTDVRWARSDLGTAALTQEVSALRCGLDAASWEGEGSGRCAGLLKIPAGKVLKEGDPLPFDLARAHALYKSLLGDVEDLIIGKSLIIVPSGPLTQLPFQVFVTKTPVGGDYTNAAWLARDHGLTVLPAVSSLKALRRVAKPSAAKKPMIGFGNPLLDGNQGDPVYGAYFKQQAALARAHESCGGTDGERVAALRGLRRGVAPMAVRGLADVTLLKAQLPLPETRDELCAVARDLAADPGEMRLGARATEHEVKTLSASGALAQYRIVHFATHGVLAGQLDPKAEPGLILTPPATPSEDDDGYLTASEIAALKLDADWVILSACNTAAGGATGAEALSGLARAFFYAQARALLVSHWDVNSDATVRLITGAVREIARDKSVGRAEALRRAMLAMIDHGKPEEAHPSYWAPFVLVGEGAASR